MRRWGVAALARMAWREAVAEKQACALLAGLYAVPAALAVAGAMVLRSVAVASVGAGAAAPVDPRELGFVLVVAALLLVEAAVIALAVLGVRVRRRLRSYGVLGVVGASRGQRAALALAGGMLPAALGALAGVVAGAVAGRLWLPAIAAATGLAALEPNLGWADVAVPVAGVLGAAAASSAVPAVMAARTAPGEALSGRRPAPGSCPRTLAITGTVLAGCGAFTVAVGALAPGVGVTLVVAGTMAVAAGAGLLVPSLVRTVAARAATWGPATRMALRDLEREWQRTVPAAGAVMACEALAVAASAVLLAGEARDSVSYAPLRALVLAACAAGSVSVVALAAGIAGAEAAAHAPTAAAIGLSRPFLRRASAIQATLLGLIGGCVAVPAGLLPAVTVLLGRRTYAVPLPWDAIAIALVGVPLLAWCCGAVSAATRERDAFVRTP